MIFDPKKHKKQYQNGCDCKKQFQKQKNTIQKSLNINEWPILESTGNLIGFIQLDSDSDLPSEIWIRDKKYKLSEKIHQNKN